MIFVYKGYNIDEQYNILYINKVLCRIKNKYALTSNLLYNNISGVQIFLLGNLMLSTPP